jgi:hypothetical protein
MNEPPIARPLHVLNVMQCATFCRRLAGHLNKLLTNWGIVCVCEPDIMALRKIRELSFLFHGNHSEWNPLCGENAQRALSIPKRFGYGFWFWLCEAFLVNF